jgi:single-strand selective monofunctional uracil DNA glycosylase
MDLIRAAQRLVRDLRPLRFGPPVTHVYDPLEYARAPYRQYVQRYGQTPRNVVLLGMNPGPWGMVQTGVPFGEVNLVRDWLGICARVNKPTAEHPKRPVLGFDCHRSEVSGARLWGWARDMFGTPDRFFARFFVANYCPLAFLEATGRNRTPDKLHAAERDPLFAACDKHLRRTIEYLRPRYVVGVGRFAEDRIRRVLSRTADSPRMPRDIVVGRVPHPSPASPAANRDWPGAMTRALSTLGLELPPT